MSINKTAIHYVKRFCLDGDSMFCRICPWSFFMALTVDMPTSFVILIGGVYKSLLRDDDPDSEVDLATSYPNSKFIAILPSHLILRVQVDIEQGPCFSITMIIGTFCWWVFLQYQLSYFQRVSETAIQPLRKIKCDGVFGCLRAEQYVEKYTIELRTNADSKSVYANVAEDSRSW